MYDIASLVGWDARAFRSFEFTLQVVHRVVVEVSGHCQIRENGDVVV